MIQHPSQAASASKPLPQSTPDQHVRRTTLRHLRQWAGQGQPFPMLTCYDATTAGLLYEAGVRVMLVGDTAAQMILGHDATLHAPLDFMLQITAAVRRGAPNALVMGDMPFGSYHCGDDQAMANAIAFLKQGQADCVKLEVDASFAPLVEKMSRAGVPVVAHLGSRPQHVRSEGGYRAAGQTAQQAQQLLDDAQSMLEAGCSALLIEAVPDTVSQAIIERVKDYEKASNKQNPSDQLLPVIGCGAGPACHGHVVVLQDLLGMTHWQPAFAKPMAQIGQAITDAAGQWVQTVQQGDYLADGGVYRSKGGQD